MAEPRYQTPTFGLASLMVLIAFIAVLIFATTPLVRALGDQDLDSPFLSGGGPLYLVFLAGLGMLIGGAVGLCSRQRLLLFPSGLALGGIIGSGSTFLLISPPGLATLVTLFLAITILVWLVLGTLHIQGRGSGEEAAAPPLVECLPNIESAEE